MTEVVIFNKVPNNDIGDARSVVITYEYSEYSFEATGATTPLNIAGSRVFHGPIATISTRQALTVWTHWAHQLRVPGDEPTRRRC